MSKVITEEAEHKKRMLVLEECLGDRYYHSGQFHNGISDAMKVYAKQENDDFNTKLSLKYAKANGERIRLKKENEHLQAEVESLKELIGRANTFLYRIDDQYQDMPDEYDAYVEDCVKLLNTKK